MHAVTNPSDIHANKAPMRQILPMQQNRNELMFNAGDYSENLLSGRSPSAAAPIHLMPSRA